MSKHDTVRKVDLRYYNAEFIKRGHYNPNMLIWWTRKEGYFITDQHGNGLNGDYRVSSKQTEQALAAI